jgi:hypothetical protein
MKSLSHLIEAKMLIKKLLPIFILLSLVFPLPAQSSPLNKAIKLIREGRWFEGVIGILIFFGFLYFLHWWNTGRWESKGKCSFCRGTGTIVRRKGQVVICSQCNGSGKPLTYFQSSTKEGLRVFTKSKEPRPYRRGIRNL